MADTIIRLNEHTRDFIIINNNCFKNKNLSMQAKGLLGYLLTLPPDWIIYKSELQNHFTNGRDAVNNAFNELIKNGYITCKKTRTEKGKFSNTEYTVHEIPVNNKEEEIDNEETDSTNGNPVTENPYTDNPSLLNTNKQNIYNKNSNSHSCGLAARKKKTETSYKSSDYSKVYKAYFANCKILYDKKLIPCEKPVLPNYITKLVKKAFDNFGVETVIEAVKDSINHQWLVEQQYPFVFIFGQNELPKLINKTYTNSKQNIYDAAASRYDMSDMVDGG